MEHTNIHQKVLTVCAGAAMLYLFFNQSQFVWRVLPVDVGTKIAYGYSSVIFAGTVYHDEGVTPVGAGSGVALHVNGTATAVRTTSATGSYTFTGLTLNAYDVITVFMNDEDEDGVLVTKLNASELNDSTVTGMDIYKDRLILRTKSTDLNLTSLDLQLADNAGDGDVIALYTYSGNDLKMGRSKELFIWPQTTHTTSGSIFTHDLDVRGTLSMGTQSVTASGSVVIPGIISTTGNMILTSVSSGETLQVNTSALYNLYLDFGLDAYFRFDEGTGVSTTGATLVSTTGATLNNGAQWVQTTSGTTLFYNPFAVEYDGTDEYVTFGDAYDIPSSSQRTYAAWFRRKSTGTEDVIFAKKTGSGTAFAGYMLYIDDQTDELIFEVSNGSSRYVTTSISTVTDQDWHHVAVSYDPLDANEANIFLDGSLDVASQVGTISGSAGNSSDLRLAMAGVGSGAFLGTIDDFRIYTRSMDAAQVSLLAAGQKTTGSGTYTLRSPLNVDNNFCVYAGTLDVGTGYTVNVAGDFCAYGGLFRSNSGSLVLDGASQVIRGSTAFHQLSKTSTSTVTLTFEANSLQTLSGAVTLRGAVNQNINIRSTRTGSSALLALEDSGATLLKYLNVQDSNASGGMLMNCSVGCVNSGNNENWFFDGTCGDGVVNSGEQCDDGDSNNADDCPNDCQLAVCGDNIVEGFEQCEPPNSSVCQSNCLLKGAGGGGGGGGSSAVTSTTYANRPPPPDGCGNGVLDIEKGEECDAGPRFNGLGTCSYDCKILVCGDGVVSPEIGENCEPKLKSNVGGVKTFEKLTCGQICTAPEVTDNGAIIGGCKYLFLAACVGTGSSASFPQYAAASCGNGIKEASEECDYGGLCSGGQFDGLFWADADAVQACLSGGGLAAPASGDGCSDTCTSEFCGDGSVQERGEDNQPGTLDDEQCDNGSVCSSDASRPCRSDTDCESGATCTFNYAANAGCSSSCKTLSAKIVVNSTQEASSECGNGITDGNEQCDDGAKNGTGSSLCSTDCRVREANTTSVCGDNLRQSDEQCDRGTDNSDSVPNACRTNCRQAFCGDAVTDLLEECDGGTEGNSDTRPDTCRVSCTLPRCGDGMVDSGEDCDGGIACRKDCTFVSGTKTCGNGIVESGESCDDGNTLSGDGCSSMCENEYITISDSGCGNGVRENGEQCDDGNSISGDGCDRFCEPEFARPSIISSCGNGILESAEACDDGNSIDHDACTNNCTVNEIASRTVSASVFVLNADVVVVNPEEIANALRFEDSRDPCSILVIKGNNKKAKEIREAAIRQGIPVVKNIELARSIFASVRPGQLIRGGLCTEINALRTKSKPSAPVRPVPQAPLPLAFDFSRYAQLASLITSKPPAGDTGPAIAYVLVAGAAAGVGWMRRRRR